MAGYNYWFPKAFGFTLDERWGKASFWCWLVGFYLAFMPLYVLGLMGMTRRMQHYDDLALAAVAGGRRRSASSSSSRGSSARSFSLSCRSAHREQRRDVTGDPWNGRTLEWSTAFAAAGLEFCGAAASQRVSTPSGSRSRRQRAERRSRPRQREYQPIEMPKNSATGFVIAFFAVITGFALIWHIWWMAGLGVFGALADHAGLRVSRRRRNRNTGRADCSVRSRAPDGGRRMNIAVAA